MKNLKTQLMNLINACLDYTVAIQAGFLISYLLFFIRRIFFAGHEMQFFEYIPIEPTIGVDLKRILFYSDTWLVKQSSPYVGANLYPPFASVFFTPFTTVDFSVAYKTVTLISFFSCFLATVILTNPNFINRRINSLAMLTLVTGLFSYGFQFELERGQFNLIATFFCYAGIWIYQYHNNYRFLAYLLFCISVQLKVYPFIFALMFINHHESLKDNIKKITVLGIFNFLLLFILGPSIFLDFIRAIKLQARHSYIWNGNHSINSFVTLFVQNLSADGWLGVERYSVFIQLLLLATVIACILVVAKISHQQKTDGINSKLLLACALGALLISSPSHDYKLAILITPVAVFFSNENIMSTNNISQSKRLFKIVLLFIFSIAYSTTLFSFTNKPLILDNNFYALYVMLLSTTMLSLVIDKSAIKHSLNGEIL